MERPRMGRRYVRKVQEDDRHHLEQQQLAKKCENLIGALESDRARLRADVRALEDSLACREQERSDLFRQLAKIMEENQRLAADYGRVEHESSNLANLYVTSFQLQGTLDREELLTAIQEVVIALIGCEELAVFELDRAGKALSLVSSLGIDSERLRCVSLGSGVIGRSAQSGEPYIAAGRAGEGWAPAGEGITACIPLKIDGKVMGAIVLFRLLGHKPALDDADHELLELLATHAARALYCTALHARALRESA